MSDQAIQRPFSNHQWPMTAEAWRSLIDELGRLWADVGVLARQSDLDHGLVHIPLAKTGRRLEMLTGVLDAADQGGEPERVVIGRRTTLLEADDESVTYALVFPGSGDPIRGWISADSPLGVGVLGSCAGDVVEVIAPAGCRVFTMLAVD